MKMPASEIATRPPRIMFGWLDANFDKIFSASASREENRDGKIDVIHGGTRIRRHLLDHIGLRHEFWPLLPEPAPRSARIRSQKPRRVLQPMLLYRDEHLI